MKGANIMINKLVELLDNEGKALVYKALETGIKVLATTNSRLVPNAMVAGRFTIGVSPKDESYFDFEITLINKTLDTDSIKMIQEYTTQNGIDKGRKAFEQTPYFNLAGLQYDFMEFLKLAKK